MVTLIGIMEAFQIFEYFAFIFLNITIAIGLLSENKNNYNFKEQNGLQSTLNR